MHHTVHMALVNTNQVPITGSFGSPEEVLNAIRGAAADELSAQNLYNSIRKALIEYGADAGIIEGVIEIMNDEIMHLGKLLNFCNMLEEYFGYYMQKGVEGE